MLPWISLLPDIRRIILELLVQKNCDLASYAVVCKEWQPIMERKNFSRLKLQVSCLDVSSLSSLVLTLVVDFNRTIPLRAVLY